MDIGNGGFVVPQAGPTQLPTFAVGEIKMPSVYIRAQDDMDGGFVAINSDHGL